MANVFLLADGLPLGGVTSFVKTLAGALQHRGHRVTVLIHEGADEGEERWPEGVALEKLVVSRLDTRATVSRRVRRRLVDAVADWVFFNNCFFADSSALHGTDIQGVYIVHGNGEEEVERFSKEGLYCRHIVGPTPGVAARFARAFPGYHVSHIPHGTAVPAERVIKPAHPFEVLYLGRLSQEKGVDLLPQIFSPLLQKYPDVRCTVLGNAAPGGEAYADEVRSALRAIEPDDARLSLRASAPGAKEAALPAAHVLLMPSRTEAFGLSAIEGAAWGAVPVVTRIAGVTDRIFEDGVNALLLAESDADAFADALIKLYEDAAFREQLADAAYRNVRAHFGVEAMADGYEGMMAHPLPPAAPFLNKTQRAFSLYRHLLFLRARRALHRG